MTYDVHRNTIYWTDTNGFVVQLSLSGGEPAQHVRNEPTSIAVDYIGQRLYWIEPNSVWSIVYLYCALFDTCTDLLYVIGVH